MMFNLFSRKRTVSPAEERFSFAAIGYPKVGNTWLRFMLGRYIQRLGNLPELPLLEPGGSDALSQAVGPAACGYFTHAPLAWTSQTANDLTKDGVVSPFINQKVILLVRHPMDVIVSHYWHNSAKLDANARFKGSLAEFVDDQIFGLNKLLKFYEIWRQGRGEVPGLLLWRYEDARSDPMKSLQQIIEFLELPMDFAVAEDAVRFSSFENMKSIESSGKVPVFRSSGFKVFGPGDRTDPNAYHVRNGKIGEYKESFCPNLLAKYERVVSERLSEFYGY